MSLTNLNIPGLIHGCKQNNRESQQELYRLLYDYAFSITHRYANDDQEANALVNDSFLKLFTHIDSCRLDKSTNLLNSFKGWFKRIIVNTCIDKYRSNKNIRQYETESEGRTTVTDHHENGEDKMSYKEILMAVKQLSSAYRTVFNLHVVEGFSHEEIATMLDISIGTSKSNLSKAKEKLRLLLQNKMNYTISYDAATGQRG